LEAALASMILNNKNLETIEKNDLHDAKQNNVVVSNQYHSAESNKNAMQNNKNKNKKNLSSNEDVIMTKKKNTEKTTIIDVQQVNNELVMKCLTDK
jgi:hypothetical protein